MKTLGKLVIFKGGGDMSEIPNEVLEAHKLAAEALKNSHSPYSKLQVACALRLKSSNQCVTGVNVENASYGGTICAERSAIVSAVSQFGSSTEFEFAVVISTFEKGPIPPCGMCLQVFKEFVGDSFRIYLGDKKGVTQSFTMAEFLPHSFSSDQLPS